ncbi:hypothetical protein K3495_g3509 [Podosphaera aphanis]|nr:hypothetical protein K3495_g3509 [Podosphaera aphanis]
MNSQQVIKLFETGIFTKSLEDVRQFRLLLQEAEVLLKWVPGNAGIQGNEEADATACAALKDLPELGTQPERITLAYLRGLRNQQLQRKHVRLDIGSWTYSCVDASHLN